MRSQSRIPRCLFFLFFFLCFFFFNDTATTEIYTLSLHDALPIFASAPRSSCRARRSRSSRDEASAHPRSEEHTSELQSRFDLVCRLLLEKKKGIRKNVFTEPAGITSPSAWTTAWPAVTNGFAVAK